MIFALGGQLPISSEAVGTILDFVLVALVIGVIVWFGCTHATSRSSSVAANQ
jgi:hypothetical protein